MASRSLIMDYANMPRSTQGLLILLGVLWLMILVLAGTNIGLSMAHNDLIKEYNDLQASLIPHQNQSGMILDTQSMRMIQIPGQE